MLSTPSACSGVALQLARCLAPLAGSMLRATACRGLVQSTAAHRAQPALQPEPEQDPAFPGNVIDAIELDFLNRSAHPEEMWAKVVSLCLPQRCHQQPVAVNISLGSVNCRTAAVELAKRGFNVLSISAGEASALRHALLAGRQGDEVDVITASLEPQAVSNGVADVVTLHAPHLLEARAALLEAHRILRPGGKLAVTFADRDLGSWVVDELEEVMEIHSGGIYSRAAGQHPPTHWGHILRQGGLFRVVDYSIHPSAVTVEAPEEVPALLQSQTGVAPALQGPAHDDFVADVTSLAECRFGRGPVVLPMQSRLFVLEKTLPRCLQ